MSPRTRALSYLYRAGLAHHIHEYAISEKSGERVAYGVAAAAALGVEPFQMFKTLLVRLNRAPHQSSAVLALVPADREASMKAIARAMKVRGAELMPAEAVQATTGYVIGGVSPFGIRPPLPVLIDESARVHDEIYVSAGRRGCSIEMSPTDLIAALDATVAPITAGGLKVMTRTT